MSSVKARTAASETGPQSFWSMLTIDSILFRSWYVLARIMQVRDGSPGGTRCSLLLAELAICACKTNRFSRAARRREIPCFRMASGFAQVKSGLTRWYAIHIVRVLANHKSSVKRPNARDRTPPNSPEAGMKQIKAITIVKEMNLQNSRRSYTKLGRPETAAVSKGS